jgi:hypothetical protein
MAPLLAARELRAERSVIRLEVSQPVYDSERGHWSCAFRVLGDDRLLVEDEAIGSDALQAIISGISGLRWQFDDGPLYGFLAPGQSWFEDEPGPGLPLILPQGLGKEFDLRLRQMVDDAVKARLRELELRTVKI